MGLPGIARVDVIVVHADKVRMSLNTCKTINDETSTMTFDDLMAFVGADYAVVA